MEDRKEKIKIKRSDGRVQYVTRDELEDLNDRRKRRDQERKPYTFDPFKWLVGFMLLVIVIIIAVRLI